MNPRRISVSILSSKDLFKIKTVTWQWLFICDDAILKKGWKLFCFVFVRIVFLFDALDLIGSDDPLGGKKAWREIVGRAQLLWLWARLDFVVDRCHRTRTCDRSSS